MDKKTLKTITRRVLEYSKEADKKGRAKEELDTHLEALAEVFGVSLEEVTEISNQVIATQKNKKTFISHLLDHYWKYMVAIILILVIFVLFFLLTKIESLEKGTTLNQISVATETNLLPLQATNITQNNTQYLHKAIFSQILVSIIPIRISIIEFFQMEGDYPSQFEDMGLNREEMKSGKYIRDIRLGTNGKIIIKATEQLGDDITIIYAVKEVMGGLNIEWQCKTNYQQSKLYFCEQLKLNSF